MCWDVPLRIALEAARLACTGALNIKCVAGKNDYTTEQCPRMALMCATYSVPWRVQRSTNTNTVRH
eukprot:CAMPEP_0115173888 /NCGR_PEP_ID=MMETSP0270-20121206/3556_1 /TAXON_ID=71861 /ORGANISM="Scrippsiella trochoidea, Strain CCMP3099" /LENGTH=65 /DNA_ID=CAMNT_0002586711 /DNA_START=73 /DNA_END=270 /DNA_ORIENTATION=+